ncbi:YjbH domain-containing protein [Paracoccus jiaweipingae]|uniref:YjbH domain-containing protein n=1 Tax=unclassified Paracoccus (in: a-proteobacteria) TaxID=2688777 RepID=UPI0037A0C8C3
MRRSPRYRLLMATTLPAALFVISGAGSAGPLIGQGRNTYGMPGAIDTPTAEVYPDATLGAATNKSDYAQRNNLIFQAAPQLTVGLRYSKVDGIDQRLGYLWDRSFDAHYQVFGEQGWRPAVAVGLRDFIGTGLYSGEYIVATKSLTPDIRVSAGIGWGRLAGKARPIEYGDEGGKLNSSDWFRGGAKPFGSITWQATDRLSFAAEYANDKYTLEEEQGIDAPDSHLNLGVTYRLGEAYQISAYTIGGKTFGAQFSFALNPRQSPYPSGLEPAPAPVRPRPAPAADPEGWSGHWHSDPSAQPAIQTALAAALKKDGQVLESMSLGPQRAEIRIDNRRYVQQAEAVGRAARLMTRALPPSVETLVITNLRNGVPVSSVTLRRSDVERLENTAAAHIAARATITDAPARAAGLVAADGVYPRLRWSLKPYLSTSIFDPEEPFRYEVGASLSGSYEFTPGLFVDGELRQRVAGNLGKDSEHKEPTSKYIVRSDSWKYSGQTAPVIRRLAVTYNTKLSDNLYGQVSAGMLEHMYGGLHGEVLWKPVNSRLAIGAELSRVKKRSPEQLFEFEDYETTTGFVTAYYDFGGGYVGSIAAGQFLAKDKGVSVGLDREFANGWKLGAFATKTDMSAEEFGEGSFDKGIRLSIPLGWATGQPSKATVGQETRSLTRDGGARLDLPNRLYDTVRPNDAGKLYEGWGKFWR